MELLITKRMGCEKTYQGVGGLVGPNHIRVKLNQAFEVYSADNMYLTPHTRQLTAAFRIGQELARHIRDETTGI